MTEDIVIKKAHQEEKKQEDISTVDQALDTLKELSDEADKLLEERQKQDAVAS